MALTLTNILNEVANCVKEHNNHPNKKLFKGREGQLESPNFCFDFVTYNEILTELYKLNIKEPSQKTGIPVDILKEQKQLG